LTDHAVDVQELMPGHDKKEIGMRTDAVVLLHLESGGLDAGLVAAFAQELDRPFGTVDRLAHALVDFAEENLVPNQSFDFLGHDGPFP
jgi:hypothetical protein